MTPEQEKRLEEMRRAANIKGSWPTLELFREAMVMVDDLRAELEALRNTHLEIFEVYTRGTIERDLLQQELEEARARHEKLLSECERVLPKTLVASGSPRGVGPARREGNPGRSPFSLEILLHLTSAAAPPEGGET